MKPKKKNKKKKTRLRVPSLYLDTNIIRSLIEKKPAILVNLMQTIKNRKWNCFTSTFAILELSDLKKDDVYFKKKIKERAEYKEIIRGRDQKSLKPKDLRNVRRYVDRFLEKYSFFSAYQIPTEVWLDALTMTLNSNIHSIDGVHLAAALSFRANVLVTSDTHFINESNIILKRFKLDKKLRVVLPEKIFDTLSSLGFRLDK